MTDKSVSENDEGADTSNSGLTPNFVLSERVLMLLWCFIFIYEVIVASVLAGFSYLYFTANDRNSLVGFLKNGFLFSQAQSFLTTVSEPLAMSFFCLGCMFAYGAITMLVYSLVRRRFCYSSGGMGYLYKTSEEQESKRSRFCSAVLRPIELCFEMFSIWRSFGIRGRYFQAGNLVREIIETVMITITAYSSSRTISNVYINQGYGVLIAMNCFLPTILSRVFRGRNPTLERLVCVFGDMILDLVWGTVIPILVFLPYIRLYQMSQTVTYVAPPNVEQEVERILVLSMSSFIQAMFPFLSTLTNLRAIKQMLSEIRPTRVHAGTPPAADERNTMSKKQVTIKHGDDTFSKRLRILHWLSHWAHRVLFFYGVVILAISISASNLFSREQNSLYDCSHRVYPWFTSKVACAGRTILCATARLEGKAEEIASALNEFDESTLSTLVLSDCSQLEIPGAIKRFSRINRFTISNSHLLEWGSNAFVTDVNFHNIQTVVMKNVTLTQEPVGFTRVKLPISLEWVSLSQIDMSPFIDEIGDNWNSLKYFYCDACNLTRLPKILRAMEGLLEFSAIGNAITSIDETQFAPSVLLNNLWLDESPLSTLPDSLWEMSSNLWDFSFQQTNIGSVPLWVNGISNDNLKMYGYGTPLCANATEAEQVSRLTCDEVSY